MRVGEFPESLQQAIDVGRRQWPQSKTQFSRRRDHVGLDAAFDAADVETQSGQAAEAFVREGIDVRKRQVAPADCLMHGAVGAGLLRRCMTGGAGKTHQYRADAAMCKHGLRTCGLGHQHGVIGQVTRKKGGNAAWIIGFLVRGEQEGGIALRGVCRSHQCGRGTLDVAGTEADRAALADAQDKRIRRPVRRIGYRIEMHVEKDFRLAARRKQTDRTGTMIGNLDLETGQVSAQVVEDAIAVDRARRIARIEGNHGAQMIERGGQQFAHAPFPRFTSAHKVELMP